MLRSTKKYRHADGTEMTISRVCWDTGGIDGEIVYQRSKKHGVFRVLPVKGASVYGKPVITMPKTRNQRGVYLCEVGTDTAKEILYARMKADPTPADEATSYAIRFPDDPEIFFADRGAATGGGRAGGEVGKRKDASAVG
ncbi:phage terminase large subunit family protein [Escherichia coli]|nr:phage terminase large subunit family protein [Escherichia coli]